jgi:nucleotide-binding universal stress UspA family protein
MVAPEKTRLLNILLADDGSLNARAAAQLLADLPHDENTLITALRVFTPVQGAEYTTVAESVTKTMNFLRSRHLRSHSEVALGYPVEKIIEFADTHHPDLVVMGAKGSGMFAGMLGSVAMSVVHDGRWPVMIVREPVNELKNILLVVDGSPCSQAACNYLGAFPLPAGSRVEALHVLPRMEFQSAYIMEPSGMTVMTLSEAEQHRLTLEAEADAMKLLDATRFELTHHGLDVVTQMVWGDPAETIVEYARNIQADLIVCGSRGLGTLTSLLLGSVSQHLVMHAPCSVLVVRSPHLAK